MKLKICGLTKEEEAKWVGEAGADYAGIVLFYPRSKRNMTIEGAKKIIKALPEKTKAVAVVVSPSLAQIREIEAAGFSVIQIHGDIPEEDLHKVKLPIIRAFNGKNYEEMDTYAKIERCVGFVFDAAEPGSGKTFDWETLKQLPRTDKLFILSGGLTVENVEHAMEVVRPDGVDVSSGVEFLDGTPGKDLTKIKAFAQAVKAYKER